MHAKKLDTRIFYILCATIPVITIFHASFSESLQPFLLIFRAFLIPFFAYLLTYKLGNPFLIFILIIYLLITGFEEFVINNDRFLMNFVFFLSIIPLFRLGYIAPSISDPTRLGYSLIWASLLLNFAVFSLFLLVFLGYIDLFDVYAIFDPARDAEKHGITRFSIGNAIEVPLLSSALCYAAQRIMPNSGIVIFALILNFVLATISGSRIVILIAAIILLLAAIRANSKILFALLFSFFIYFLVLYWVEIGDYLENIINRFLGDDGGSGSDRLELYRMTYRSMTFFGFIFGEGLSSSFQMMFEQTDTFRTIEAFALEILYELGIVGFVLYVLTIIDGLNKKIFIDTFLSFPLLLMWMQILLFLPLNPLFPITLFCIGVASNSAKKDNSIKT